MKISKKDYIILSIGLVFIFTINYIIRSGMMKPEKNTKISKNTAKQELFIEKNDLVFGSNDAPITLFFYGDFACHHCIRFIHENFAKLREQYISTGKVKFVFRPIISTRATLAGIQYLFCEKRTSNINMEIFLQLFESKFVLKKDFINELLNIVKKNYWSNKDVFLECLNSSELQQSVIDKHKHYIKDLNIKGTPVVIIEDKPVKADRTIFNIIKKTLSEKEKSGH